MLLWTTLGLAVVSFLIYLIGRKVHNWSMENVGCGMTAIFSLILVIMLIAIAFTYIGADAYFTKCQSHREFLVAQYKTGVYDGSVLSQYHLLQQIDEWNCDLAERQKLTHDYWVGIFVPNYYDDLEYITVNLFEDVITGRE